MAIRFSCDGCGATFSVPDNFAGKRAKCKKCGAPVQVPAAVGEAAATSAAPAPMPAAAPAPVPAPAPAPGALQAMNCQSCGGTVEYAPGQGYFECKYCHSKYAAATDGQGNSVVQTIELRELRKKMNEVGGELTVTRLQKNAQTVQDKLDFKFVEFYHSFGRKAGSIAVVCWIIGGLVLLFGFDAGIGAIAFGLLLVGAGFGLFFGVFKKAQAAMNLECDQIRESELEPLYQRLRKIGATLDGGDVSLGYTESTSTPIRYCVCCHKNVTPSKARGGGISGAVTGINLWLTIFTCGMWIPAWIFIAIMMKAGGSARRAVQSGICPQCGTTPLFPARIESVG